MSIPSFKSFFSSTRIWSLWSVVLVGGILAGCDIPVIHPKGMVASEQRDLMITSLLLMLIVVVPVIILTLVFTFRYRDTNQKAKYTPDWDDNAKLEIIWWSVPIVIIVILASITWRTSHELDPYKELAVKERPIEIQVVALPWKWLFLYPEQGIAVVNHVRFPVEAPVNFKITAQAPMNSFWIPHLAGQIYAMEGMQTKLSVKADTLGSFPGYSANFSGEGHNGMKFIAKASTRAEFDAWVDSVKKAQGALTRGAYDSLAEPTMDDPVRTWASFQPGLFLEIMMSYMLPPDGDATKMSCHKPKGGHGDHADHAAMPMADCPRHMMGDSAAMADCPKHMPDSAMMAECIRRHGGDTAKAKLECPRFKGGDTAAGKLDCHRHKAIDSGMKMPGCPRHKGGEAKGAPAAPAPKHIGHDVEGHSGH